MGGDDPAAATDCAGGTNEGLGKSFIVKTYFGIGPDGGVMAPAGFMDSRCVNVQNDTRLRMPMGDPIARNGLMEVKIFSYSDQNCQGEVVEYKFGKGLSNPPQASRAICPCGKDW